MEGLSAPTAAALPPAAVLTCCQPVPCATAALGCSWGESASGTKLANNFLLVQCFGLAQTKRQHKHELGQPALAWQQPNCLQFHSL